MNIREQAVQHIKLGSLQNETQARRFLVLHDAVEVIKSRPQCWCPDCGWTGNENDLACDSIGGESTVEDSFYCAECGCPDVGDFDAAEYAHSALKSAEEIE